MSLGGSLPPEEPWSLSPMPPKRGRDLFPIYRGADLGLPMTGPGSIAGLGVRALGAIVDSLIFVPITIVHAIREHARWVQHVDQSGFVTHRFTLNRLSTVEALLFLIPFAVYTIGLIGWRGQTLGQQLLGLRTIRISDRAVPGYNLAAVRFVVADAGSIVLAFLTIYRGWIPLYPLLVYAWAIWDGNRQGLHDKAARVIVVRTR
jgi:uncharacterized RDD family membrane protein YckC